jgi:putative transposase
VIFWRSLKVIQNDDHAMTAARQMTMIGDVQAGHPLGADDAVPVTARDAVNRMVEAGLLDRVMSQVDAGELALTGDGGFLPEMIKAVLEQVLAAEQTAHLGYEKGRPGRPWDTELAQRDHTEDRGHRGRRRRPRCPSRPGWAVRAAPGAQGLAAYRRSRREIISLYAGGMTVRDIAHHLQRTLGTELSHDTISEITDSVLEVKAWQSRPLEEIYSIVCLCADDQGAGWASGPQPGRTPRRRGRSRWRQTRARDLGPSQRGHEALGRGVRGPA